MKGITELTHLRIHLFITGKSLPQKLINSIKVILLTHKEKIWCLYLITGIQFYKDVFNLQYVILSFLVLVYFAHAGCKLWYYVGKKNGTYIRIIWIDLGFLPVLSDS